MFEFMKRAAAREKPPSSASAHSTQFDSTRQEGSLQSELIRAALNDTLRLNGIPLDMVQPETQLRLDAGSGAKFMVALVVTRWSEALVHYAPALARQVLAGLDHYEPQVDHSDYLVSWRFAKDCACPHESIPANVSWLHSDVPVDQDEEVEDYSTTAWLPPRAE